MIDYNEASENSSIKTKLSTENPTFIIKTLLPWIINSIKNLNPEEELNFLVFVIRILSKRLPSWIDSHVLSPNPKSNAEQDAVYQLFKPNGWLFQTALKHRIQLGLRYLLLSQNDVYIVNETNSDFDNYTKNPLPKNSAETKTSLWKIPLEAMPESVQIGLQMEMSEIYSNFSSSFEGILSRCFIADRNLKGYIYLDVFEFLIFSVVSSLGNVYYDSTHIPNINEGPFKPTETGYILSPEIEPYLNLARDYINFFIPIKTQIQVAPHQKNEYINKHSNSFYSTTFWTENTEQTILNIRDQGSEMMITKFFVDLVASFWLPHAHGPSLVSALTKTGGTFFETKELVWKPSKRQLLGLKCFHLVVESLTIAELWMEKKTTTKLEGLDFDKQSFHRISQSESIYKMIRENGFGSALVESIGWVFGSKAGDKSIIGTNVFLSDQAKLEIECISLLTECWVEYLMPWTSFSICRSHSTFDTIYDSHTLPKSTNIIIGNEIPPEWEFRISRMFQIAPPELYGSALGLFISAVVPSFDLLAIEPCLLHHPQKFPEVEGGKFTSFENANTKSSFPSTKNSSEDEKKTLKDIIKSFEDSEYGNFKLCKLFEPENTNPSQISNHRSPFKRASAGAEIVRARMNSALGIKQSCTCSFGLDMLYLLTKVIYAFDYGYTKVALASVEISTRYSYFQKPGSDSIMQSLWLRNPLDFETKETIPNKIYFNPQGQQILETKNFGKINLLNPTIKDLIPQAQDLLSRASTKSSYEPLNYTSYENRRYTTYGNIDTVSRKFYSSIISAFLSKEAGIDAGTQDTSLFTLHSHIIFPFLLSLFEAAQKSKIYSMSLNAVLEDSSPTSSSLHSPVGNSDIGDFSHSQPQFPVSQIETISKFRNVLSSIKNNSYLHSLLETSVKTVEPGSPGTLNAKYQAISFNTIHHRILFVISLTSFLFGITPSEITKALETINLGGPETENKPSTPNFKRSLLLQFKKTDTGFEKRPSADSLPSIIVNNYEESGFSTGVDHSNIHSRNISKNSDLTLPSGSGESPEKYLKQRRENSLVGDIHEENQDIYFELPPTSSENMFVYRHVISLERAVNSYYQNYLNGILQANSSSELLAQTIGNLKKIRFSFRFLAAYNNWRFAALIFVLYRIFRWFISIF
ncbi:hypothetical protein BB558_006552 [Smittium angustum]|uniref:Uncharacterized protein n=1 Tax=Smittium angustum TaxID=133377 RepID=A0A2U1IXF1_SMIAN|nr:hypothetical protein BB558_006552 [Smittium angustum]